MELLNRNAGSLPSFNFCVVEHCLNGERLEACVRVLASFAKVQQNVLGCPNKMDEKCHHKNVKFLLDENMTMCVTMCN
jgi:hypothetical protein